MPVVCEQCGYLNTTRLQSVNQQSFPVLAKNKSIQYRISKKTIYTKVFIHRNSSDQQNEAGKICLILINFLWHSLKKTTTLKQTNFFDFYFI